MSRKNRKSDKGGNVARVQKPQNEFNHFRQNKVKAKSKNQKSVLQSIYNNAITFAVGPAGTGKTHLSVGVGVDLLQRGKVEKIVIARPVVEAGNRDGKSKLGYLPGDIKQKMSHYLRPIYDELGKFINQSGIKNLEDSLTLEICPLEFMRGRTFENTYIICDEAQNATEEQIEMLVTRLGNGSKMVVVGDVEQTDLPRNLAGGFENFIEDLDGLESLGIIYLEAVDVARHPLVKMIIERRRAVKAGLNLPASLERVGYNASPTWTADISIERRYEADSDNPLDGLIQEDIQGDKLP